jgi:hypothetical protein
MSLKVNHKRKQALFRKQTKNVIKTYQYINNIQPKRSYIVDHRKKSLINPNAEFKNYVLLDEFKKQELHEKQNLEEKKKLERNPLRLYDFDLKFLNEMINSRKNQLDICYLKALPKLEEICESIKNFKCNIYDLKYLCKQEGNKIIDYAKHVVPDELALPKKIDNESMIISIFKIYINKKNNVNKRVICFQLLNLIIKQNRLIKLKNKLKSVFSFVKKSKKSKKNKINNIEKILFFTLNKYIDTILLELGNKHLKYLLLK